METTIQLNGYSYVTHSEAERTGYCHFDGMIGELHGKDLVGEDFFITLKRKSLCDKIIATNDPKLIADGVPPISERNEEPTTPKENCDAECGGFSTDKNHVCCKTPKEQFKIGSGNCTCNPDLWFCTCGAVGEFKAKTTPPTPKGEAETVGEYSIGETEYEDNNVLNWKYKTCVFDSNNRIFCIVYGEKRLDSERTAREISGLKNKSISNGNSEKELNRQAKLRNLDFTKPTHEFADGWRSALEWATTQPESTNPNRPKERVFTESEMKESFEAGYQLGYGYTDALEFDEWVNQNHK